MMKRGLQGDSSASRAMMEAIEEVRATRMADISPPLQIVLVGVYPGSVTLALETLRMGRKLDRFRPSIRVVLEPWLVQAALARFGERRLSREEQETVVEATRTPDKVDWPDWWEVKP